MTDIITVGELLIDLTQTHIDGHGIRHYAANPGGAPANVAVAGARLGANTAFVGKVGADTYGRDLRAVLVHNGVDVSGLYETGEALTTQAVVSVGEGGERDFAFYRAPGADSLLTEEEALSALDRPFKALHFGSVCLTREPAASATLAAAKKAKEHGALVSYDPNYRAFLWPDLEAALVRMRQPLALADIVKLSEEELELLGGSGDPEAGSKNIAGMGPALVLVTLGSKGTFYRLGANVGIVPGVKIQVADTNGAGDTFQGAFLRCLTRRENCAPRSLSPGDVEEMLRFANVAAALTCSRSGAIPAMPTLEETEAFLRQNAAG